MFCTDTYLYLSFQKNWIKGKALSSIEVVFIYYIPWVLNAMRESPLVIAQQNFYVFLVLHKSKIFFLLIYITKSYFFSVRIYLYFITFFLENITAQPTLLICYIYFKLDGIKIQKQNYILDLRIDWIWYLCFCVILLYYMDS